MNSSFKTTDPNQRSLFGTGDIGIVAGPKGKKNSICWKSIEIWNVYNVLGNVLEDNRNIDKARNHADTEVRRLNRVIWCKHIVDAQLEVGPRKAWDPDDLPRGWPTLQARTYKSIPLNELTDIILAHRALVHAWNQKRLKPVAVVPAVVEIVAPEVVAVVAAAAEPEFSLESGVDDWEDF